MASLASGADRKCSGVARVHWALGQETFLHPFNKKLQSLKWKIGAKVRKKYKKNIFC